MIVLAVGTYSLVELLIFVIVLAGIVGVVLVVLRHSGVVVPPWVIQILWICGVVLLAVIAIRFLASLL